VIACFVWTSYLNHCMFCFDVLFSWQTVLSGELPSNMQLAMAFSGSASIEQLTNVIARVPCMQRRQLRLLLPHPSCGAQLENPLKCRC